MAGKSIAQMQREVYDTNLANGWFDEERTVGDEVALLHSEVSEMLEAYREYGMSSWDTQKTLTVEREDDLDQVWSYTKPEGVQSECADVLIRLLDFCQRHDVDLEHEFERKMACNRARGYRHGGKRL